MSKGITISVRLPEQLEAFIQEEADTQGISRSRCISNILLNWQTRRKDRNFEDISPKDNKP